MKKRIMVFSGFSGAGKSSTLRAVMDIEKKVFGEKSKVRMSISDTTRPKRNVGDDNYNFITPVEYQKRVGEGDYYIEHNAEYAEHGYGTPRAPMMEALHDGGTVILEIDRKGMQEIQRSPDLLDVDITTVFLCADENTLRERLKDRGETEDEISKRLQIAREELGYLDQYDYLFVNDDIEKTALRVWALLSGLLVPGETFNVSTFATTKGGEI